MSKPKAIFPISLAALLFTVAACTSSGTSVASDPAVDTSANSTTGPVETVSRSDSTRPSETTIQTGTGTPVSVSTTTTEAPPGQIQYAVVAEERSRRLAIIDASATCSGNTECELIPLLSIELPEAPHNLVGVGSVVYATHPSAGSISRVDVTTGEVTTAKVGNEPHDVTYEPGSETLFVADEAGRRLLSLDSETLDVVDEVDLPGEPHVLAAAGEAMWITLVGRDELARVVDGGVELFSTGASPHSLIVDQAGSIWFSSWNSEVLNVFDPTTGTLVRAPAGVSQPHHFAVGRDGNVWVSDNGGGAIVGFGAQTVAVDVGPTPHHLSFVDNTLVVAVSGSGQAVMVRNGEVVARSQLTEGLHGVAIVEVPR